MGAVAMKTPGGGRAAEGSALNHLLAEMKAELDWATTELEATTQTLAKIEASFNAVAFGCAGGTADHSALAATKDIMETELRIDRLYDLRKEASDRFAVLEDLYGFASQHWLVPVVAMNVRRLLVDNRPELRPRGDVRHIVNRLAHALHDYCWHGPSDEADERVRRAWLYLEPVLYG